MRIFRSVILGVTLGLFLTMPPGSLHSFPAPKRPPRERPSPDRSDRWQSVLPETNAFSEPQRQHQVSTLAKSIPPRGDFIPDLAATLVTEKRIRRSLIDDGVLRYVATIPLRRDVFWSDGRQLTAHDIAFSYELARSSGTAYPLFAASPQSVSTVRSTVERVDIVDDFTVRIIMYWKPSVEEWRDDLLGLPVIQRNPHLSDAATVAKLTDGEDRGLPTIEGDHRYNYRRFETIVLFKNGSVAISNPTTGYTWTSPGAGGEVEYVFER